MTTLQNFATLPFIDALKAFFKSLNVPINYLSDLPASPEDVFGEAYNVKNPAHTLIDEVFVLGTVDDKAFDQTRNIGDNDIKNADYDFILIIGITLKLESQKLPTRSQLAELTRLCNKIFNTNEKGNPVTVVFRYADCISFSNAERISRNESDYREGEKIGKVSLLKEVDYRKPHAGHIRILHALSVEAIRNYDRKNKVDDFAGLYKGWQQVFNTQILNEQFYKDYQQLSVKLIRAIYPIQVQDKLKAHQGALNLLNRLMFIYFIQKKGWLMQDPEFMFHFWQDYKETDVLKDTFHEKWLNKVFFKAFNNKAFNDPEIFKILPPKYHTAILDFPYLNGGLFTPTEEDKFILSDNVFELIFEFLQGYVFTISEDSADEINLEINPELLGKMYEGMINATDLNDVDAENGIVYTERPEIKFMTRRSMVEVLHKKLPNQYSREFLYHFCFDKPSEKLELLQRFKANANELRNAVLSTTSLDPSCGSGSMLIGMIQLQVELIRCLDEYTGKPHTPKDDFYLKKQIISECIYGVDVKEWAVRIAELRFWLYMIAEAEFEIHELNQKPLLPNLDFKLRQGNSLLQQIGSLDFSIKGLFKGRKRNAGATRKLNEFIKKKKDFITNQTESETNYKQLKDEELNVFRSFISELKIENTQQITTIRKGDGQFSMFESSEPKTVDEKQIKQIEAENEQLDKILNSIKTTGRIPFSYDIDFMEIFLTSDDTGFDLIIGNPPYVRQEDILPADDAVELERLLKPENKTEKALINKAYKEQLSAKVYETYPFLATKAKTMIDGKNKTIAIYGDKVPGRSDLYVYFQLLMPSLLNSKGTFCFIISNSWLDVEFGGYVQQFLLKHTQLHAIYDCTVRSFSASVNTIIYLHSAIINDKLTDTQLKTFKPNGQPIKFVMNKADYTDTAYAPLLIEQEHAQANTFRNHYRVIAKTPQELWEEGYDEEQYTYQSNKWGGKYLRAPEIYFTILEKGKDKLVPLKEIANILPGCYAGISDFFYVNTEVIEKYKIENEYLIPLLRNSECVDNLSFSPTDWYVISCNQPKNEIKNGLLDYIKWGEQQVTRQRQKTIAGIPYPETESVKNRKPGWWSIPTQNLEMTDLFMQYVGSSRFYCPISNKKLTSDRSFHRIFYKDETLKISLNSSLTWFFVMLMGRANLGEGALKYEKSDAQNLLTLKVNYEKSKINSLPIFKREPLSIITELGFDKTQSIREQEPNPLPDRKELDDIIFDELGLTEAERKEVYWATAELVKQRLDKASSR